jgi:hypothetical protein
MPGVDLATLAIKVDAVGVTTATGQLNSLATAADRAAISAARLRTANAQAEAATSRAATAHLAHEAALARAAGGMARTGAAAGAMGATFRDVTRDMSASLVVMNQGISGLPYALSRVTGPMMLLGLAGVAGFAGIGFAVKEAMSVLDDYKITVISIAATLTDMAKPGQGSMEQMFARNTQHAKDMYKTMTLEAAEHFASANQMMTTYNKLVQGGARVTLEDAKAVGILTDAIKIKTKGQDVDRQLNTEIMALMQGQARAGSLIAQELKTRLGPAWAEIVEKARQNNTFFQLMVGLYPGIVAANEAIKNTMTSQWTTLKGILSLIAIDGMEGVYQSIVDTMKDMNKYLRDHAGIISDSLISGWITIRETVKEVKDTIDSMNKATTVSIPTAPSERNYGQTFAQGFKRAFDPRELSSDVDSFLTDVGRGWDRFWKGATDTNNYFTYYFLNGLEKVANYITDPKNWAWFIDVEPTKIALSETYQTLKDIANFISKPFRFIINAVLNIPDTLRSLMGLETGAAAGGGGNIATTKTTTPDLSLGGRIASKTLQAQAASKGAFIYNVPGMDWPIEIYGQKEGQTESVTNPRAAKGAKGGKTGDGGAAAEQRRLNSLFDTLTKELAALSGGKAAEIYANLEKTVNQAYKKVEERAISAAEVEVLAREVAAKKMDKLYSDTTLWVAKEYGNQTESLKAEEAEKLSLIQYNSKMSYEDQLRLWELQNKVHGVYVKKQIMNQQEIANTELTNQKAYIDALASSTPYLEDQLALQQQSLVIEEQLAQAAITKLIEQKEELAGYETIMRNRQRGITLAKQEAEIRKGWRLQGYEGALKGAYVEAKETAKTWDYDTLTSLIKSAPQTISQSMASGFVDYLRGKKVDLDEIAYSMAESLIAKQMEGFLVKLLPQALQGLMYLLTIKTTAEAAAATTEATAAATSANTLILGGVGAGNAMVNGAIEAAAILSKSGGGGGGGGGLLGGFLGKIPGLFGQATTYGSSTATYTSPGYYPGGYGYQNYHMGGLIYAHGGLNLASDEVPIIAQTGERVLSRGQNAEYESGMKSDEPPQVNITINNNNAKAQVSGQQEANGDITITIDEMVANAINRKGLAWRAIRNTNITTRG